MKAGSGRLMVLGTCFQRCPLSTVAFQLTSKIDNSSQIELWLDFEGDVCSHCLDELVPLDTFGNLPCNWYGWWFAIKAISWPRMSPQDVSRHVDKLLAKILVLWWVLQPTNLAQFTLHSYVGPRTWFIQLIYLFKSESAVPPCSNIMHDREKGRSWFIYIRWDSGNIRTDPNDSRLWRFLVSCWWPVKPTLSFAKQMSTSDMIRYTLVML